MSGGTVPGGKASLPDRIDVVFLDAGGVLVSPDPDRVRDMLSSLSDQPTSPPPTDATLVDAHYRGMAAVDATLSDPEVFDAYLPAYFGAIDLLRDDVIEAAHELWSVPYRLWTRPLPGVRGALGALARSGRATVVVSNADGRVARALAGLVGIGPGSGHRVLAIVDSGVVGVTKPDPEIFRIALDAAGVACENAVHVGDSYGFDVEGARAAGIAPIFIDPLGLHPDPGCVVVGSLTEAVALLH